MVNILDVFFPKIQEGGYNVLTNDLQFLPEIEIEIPQ